MMQTSVEDFQLYHNDRPGTDVDEILLSSSQLPEHTTDGEGHDFEDDGASASGSWHHSSGPDEAVFDVPSTTSSPRTSHGSDDDISVLESSYSPSRHPSTTFTPLKSRSPFRNPSSVRAMQMDTTPPHLMSPSSQQRRNLNTPTRQGTPRSNHSHHSMRRTPSKLSPTKKMKKEYPLVLLHVTLLPLPLQYSQEILEAVLPRSILEIWKLLQEKSTSTVLERGVLIPHPREDYDLLEERLLESLELKQPRILKCGHFHLSPEEEADAMEDSDTDDCDLEDADICADCGRRIRDGRFGNTGTEGKRWDIKLFAANGLMRSGAWSAAWKEMERVDVEILPWIEEDMKRELELRREEEEKAKAEQTEAEREEGIGGLDDERLREIYGQEAQAYVDGLSDPAAPTATPSPQPVRLKEPRECQEPIPLWDLFCKYLYLAAQDRRNIAIFMLSALVVLLSLGPLSPSRSAASSLQTAVHNTPRSAANVSGHVFDPLSKASTSLMSAVSATTSVASEPPPFLSPSSKPEVNEEVEQPSWTETTEDVASEMLDD